MEKPFVFRPFDGSARGVSFGPRHYVEGDLVLALPQDVARLARFYGGPEAFDPLTPRQADALGRAAGYNGDPSGLVPYLKGLPQAALNKARDSVRGIGDDPAPLAPPAAPAAPILPTPAPEPAPAAPAETPDPEPAFEAAETQVLETEADLMKRTLAQLLALVGLLAAPITSEQKKTKSGVISALRAAGHVKEG